MAERTARQEKWGRKAISKARPSRKDLLAEEAREIAEKHRQLKLDQERRAKARKR